MTGGYTEIYCTWFESLPPEIARELALSLMRLAPGGLLESAIMTADPLDGFVPRLKRLAQDPVRDAGTALTLATLTDFTFFERGDPDSWDKNEEILELLDEAQNVLYEGDDGIGGDLSEWIAQNKLRHPLRARQWMKEQKGWRDLRAGDLAPEAIHRALNRPPG